MWELKGLRLLIKFIDTVIGTKALIRTVASAWKLHRHAGKGPGTPPSTRQQTFQLQPSFHMRRAIRELDCGTRVSITRAKTVADLFSHAGPQLLTRFCQAPARLERHAHRRRQSRERKRREADATKCRFSHVARAVERANRFARGRKASPMPEIECLKCQRQARCTLGKVGHEEEPDVGNRTVALYALVLGLNVPTIIGFTTFFAVFVCDRLYLDRRAVLHDEIVGCPFLARRRQAAENVAHQIFGEHADVGVRLGQITKRPTVEVEHAKRLAEGSDPFHDNAPRPWGMQPNTSFRLRMCISPLMSRLNIIPFSPWHTGSQNCKTGLTFFATFHGSDFSDTATHSASKGLFKFEIIHISTFGKNRRCKQFP